MLDVLLFGNSVADDRIRIELKSVGTLCLYPNNRVVFYHSVHQVAAVVRPDLPPSLILLANVPSRLLASMVRSKAYISEKESLDERTNLNQ